MQMFQYLFSYLFQDHYNNFSLAAEKGQNDALYLVKLVWFLKSDHSKVSSKSQKLL